MQKPSKYTSFSPSPISSQSHLSSISLYLHHSLIEIRRRYCYYFLSLLSVLIVVAATSTCQSIIDNAPLIFLKTAEGSASEKDISIMPNSYWSQDDSINGMDGGVYSDLLNFTRSTEILSEMQNYLTCRMQIEGVKVGQREGSLKLISSEREKNMGLGRDYPFGKLQKGEVLIHKKLGENLKLGKGEKIEMGFKIDDVMCNLVEAFNYGKKENERVNFEEVLKVDFKVPVVIREVFGEAYGKYPDGSVENSIIMEYEYFFALIADYVKNYNGNMEFISFFKAQNPMDFTKEIIINMPDRISLYMNSNFDLIQQAITKKASIISERLGIYPFDMDLPVLKELAPQRLAAMFLGVILMMILFILFLLSVILLYSLLLVSVETKTFDFGVFRVLGLNKLGVIGMILAQSMSYVLPGILLGIIFSIPALAYARSALNNAIGVSISILPTPWAAGFSILLGFLIPIFSSYVPIREALKQNLQTALDATHSKTTAVKIIIDVEGKGFPWGRVSFSLIASVFGVSIYYLLPLSLLSFNLGLMIAILFWILIGLLLGLVILSLNVQHLMERLIVFVVFGLFLRCLVKTGIRKLILKNLAAHRIRNRRTGTMYSLSLAFVIFLIVAYDVQIKSTSFQIKQQRGVFLEVEGTFSDFYKLESFIENDLSEYVESYSWVTQDLAKFANERQVKSVYLTHIGQIFQFKPEIYGVSPNIFKTLFSEFLDIKERSSSNLNVAEELYTTRGSQSMIIGASYAEKLLAGLDYKDSLYLVLSNGTNTKKHEMRISSILNTAPGFKFSILPSVTTQAVLISLPTYKRLAELDSITSLPMSKLKLKIKNDDPNYITETYNLLNSFIFSNSEDLKIWDFRDFQKSIEKAENVISIIFIIVTIIVMFLCFFSLVSSMTANILEQTKEISVLRSIGITKKNMILVYIYEAFVLVFASSFTGLIIGTIIGFTMSIQRALFTQLPIKFDFPLVSFIVILVVSVIVSVLSTFLPSLRVLKKEISVIMKMQG